ncbi:MAG: hypothetical protein E6Q68_04725 [Polynucleobacter sp.]|nr:MAG: hypothetical protein E6Q68_04725 [Polynucleobacter sp.]
MGDMLQHSKNSAEKFGGVPSDYFAIHELMDLSKIFLGDWRHRALFHNTFGIHMMEKHIVGPTFVRKSDGVEMCTRTVVSAHIMEDIGVLPTPAEFLREMPLRAWMSKVDPKTRDRMQRMSIAGSSEPSNIDEVITWYPFPETMPKEPASYLIQMETPTGLYVFQALYMVEMNRFVIAMSKEKNDISDSVRFWAKMPIGPKTPK